MTAVAKGVSTCASVPTATSEVGTCSCTVTSVADLHLGEADWVFWGAWLLTEFIGLFTLAKYSQIQFLRSTSPECPSWVILILVASIGMKKEWGSRHWVIILGEPEQDCLYIVNWNKDWPFSRKEGALWQNLINRMIKNEAEATVVFSPIAVST